MIVMMMMIIILFENNDNNNNNIKNNNSNNNNNNNEEVIPMDVTLVASSTLSLQHPYALDDVHKYKHWSDDDDPDDTVVYPDEHCIHELPLI